MTRSCEEGLPRRQKSMDVRMAVFLALFAAALFAQEPTTSTPSAGGSGGHLYDTGCSSKAMVGLRGSTYDTGVPGVGQVVGSLQPVCVGIYPDGSWSGSPTATGVIAGINRGTTVVLQCPDHQAVSGISGRAGIYVNQLTIHCAQLVEPGHLSGEGSTLPGFIGGTGGSFFGDFICPSNKPGLGLIGGADQWIDRVALLCKYPALESPVVREIYLSGPGAGSIGGTAVVGGTPVNGEVRLNSSYATAVVNLSMSGPAGIASFQSSNPINVSGTAPFVINTNPVSSTVTTSISASPHTGSFRAPVLTIQPPSLKSISLSTTTTSPGGAVTGTASLNGKAFSGGVAVTLTSSDTATATVPSAVSIPQSQPSVTFPVSVGSASQNGCSVVSASYNQARQDALLTVRIPPNSAFGIAVTSTSGSQATATVAFPASADSARTLSLVSNKPATASVPSSVTVVPFPPGTKTANFTITTTSPVPDCAVITASDAKGNKNSVILSMAVHSVSAVN